MKSQYGLLLLAFVTSCSYGGHVEGTNYSAWLNNETSGIAVANGPKAFCVGIHHEHELNITCFDFKRVLDQ